MNNQVNINNYYPLYLYTEYCLNQSTVSLNRLIDKLKEKNLNYCFISNDSSMFGIYKYYKELIKNNILPIIGIKLRISFDNFQDVVLLYAKNRVGYNNLLKITTLLNTNKTNKTTKTIDINELLKFNQGLICISCGSESIIYNYLNKEDYDGFKNHGKFFLKNFENYYIGLQSNTKETSYSFDKYCQMIHNIGFKTVITNKVNQINQNDKVGLEVLIKHNNPNIIKLSDEDINGYFDFTYRQLKHLSQFKELFINQNEIISLCSEVIDINNKVSHFPKYSENNDEEDTLYKLSYQGLRRRIEQNNIFNTEIYFKRLEYEYNVIKQMGLCGYFLIVYDYVKYAKNNNIVVGPGRGSAVSCLISYCLGISEIDPVKYNLLFERFLNPERVSMPDIDIDFQSDRIKDVINYVLNKYGKKRVGRITTFDYYRLSSAIDACQSVYKIDSVIYTSLTMILNDIQKETSNPSLDLISKENEKLSLIINDYPEQVGLLIQAAKVIQNLPEKISTHVSGIVLSDEVLAKYTPIEAREDYIYQTEYTESELEAQGLLKVDFLPLTTLTDMNDIINLIKKDYPDFKLPKDNDNPMVYQMLRNGLVSDLFQVSGIGYQKFLINSKVSSFDDLVSALAVYRPGANNTIKEYIDCKLGRKPITYFHKDLEPILKDTYGFVIYEEQIMRIALKFAGYSLNQADYLRAQAKKKNKEVIIKERSNFVNSCIKNGYSEEIGNSIYDYFVKFADFGFNQAHAVAYGRLSYLVAYLKCLYPEYFYAITMKELSGSKLYASILQAKKLGVKIYPPRINESAYSHVVYPKSILLGFSSLHDVLKSDIDKIIEERNNNGNYKSIEDFINRNYEILKEKPDLIKKIIYAGMFAEFKMTKKDLVEASKYYMNVKEYGKVPGLLAFNIKNEEYTFNELFEYERISLGMNLSYTFLSLYKNVYEVNHLITIKEVIDSNLQNIRTFGKVKDLHIFTSKKQETMAKISLDDSESIVNVTIFPSVYKDHQDLQNGDIVIIIGKKELWKDVIQINCNSLQIIEKTNIKNSY